MFVLFSRAVTENECPPSDLIIQPCCGKARAIMLYVFMAKQ